MLGVARQDVGGDCGQVDGEGGLADPALLVRDDMYSGHVVPLRVLPGHPRYFGSDRAIVGADVIKDLP